MTVVFCVVVCREKFEWLYKLIDNASTVLQQER